MIGLLFFLAIFVSCESHAPQHPFLWETILGRDAGDGIRIPLYTAKVARSWHSALSSHSVADTMLPLITFTIPTPHGDVLLTVHNFPYIQVEPVDQIKRWKEQFDELDLTTTSIQPQAFGGFCGLLFEGSGRISEEKISVIGWSMHTLQTMRCDFADYTIKAKGAIDAISYAKQEILQFGQSFRLIEEIPCS